jgi:hypothetical protein
MSRKPAAAKRVRLFADAMEMEAGQGLMPGHIDAIAKAIHSKRTELRTNRKCGAMGFAEISYTPDVFGLVRREVETDEALAAVQQFQVEATYLTLTSNVVAAAIQEASLRGQIAATKKIIAIETDLLRLLRIHKKLGQVTEADVALQEAALAQAEETLPPLEKQLAQQRDLLTALAGRYPSEEVAQKLVVISLTPHTQNVDCESRAEEETSPVAGAPGNEIEITSEMIMRGVTVLSEYMIWDSPKAEIVEAIYRAMRR